MKEINFFYRKTNPAFFSIERVFEGISGYLSEAYGQEFKISSFKLPLPSKLQNLLPNIRFSRQRQGSVNHMTGDAHYVLLGWSRRKVNILTLHDCVLLHRLSRSDPRYWIIKWLWHEWPARKADGITVISENTKKDLLHFTHCDPDKIHVIPNFIDPAFQAAPFTFSTERPRILFVGTTDNKNLDRLAVALKGIPAELDIIGSLTEAQSASLQQNGIVFHQSSGLSQEQLLQHYKDCDLLAFPSTYEGFGLPIIEGQAIGRPVLTSDLSPMREVAGAGACLIDPMDINSIREGLLRIIGEEPYRHELIRAGLENVKRFRLQTVADQYAQLYRTLLQKKGI